MLKKIVIYFMSAFLVVCAYGITMMHVRYQNPERHIYEIGETFQIDDLEFCVNKVDELPYDEFIQKNQIDDLRTEDLGFEENVISAEIEVVNQGEKEEKVPLYLIPISSRTSSTCSDYYLQLELAECDIRDYPYYVLQPGESIVGTVTYEIGTVVFGIDDGYFLNQVPLELVFHCYPDRYSVRLNDLW